MNLALPALAATLLLLPSALGGGLPGVGNVETYFIPANGAEVATSPTQAGTVYTLTILGVWVYSDSLPMGLADCAYVSPNGLSPWIGPNFLVMLNGARLDCGPYSPAHAYSVSVAGTGQPLRLRIRDSIYADNAGGLAVVLQPAQ